MMNSFSALHKYDLEIRFNRRDLYQTSAFCGHVFTMKLLLNKITLGHMTENKCGYQMHIFVTSFSKAARPCVAVLLHGAATSSAISPQMHQQNPADAPPESRGTIRIRRTPTESCLHLQRDNVTTPGDNLQTSSTKRAFIECMFLPRRLRSLHQGYFPDLIDQNYQHSVSTGIHVIETRSQQSARAACTQLSAWRCLTCKQTRQ